MNKRKLVSLRKVGKIFPIKNADRIEEITVDGWSVVAKKGEFKEGDTCCFFEIDSFLPDESRYEFLGKPKTFNGKQGHRIKTIKLKGVLSQGLALPLSMFDGLEIAQKDKGCDISEELSVIKYDPNETTGGASKNKLQSGKAKGKFPIFLKKTDQERIQNLTNHFEQFKEMEFEETLKLDGSSMTCFKVKEELTWYKRKINEIHLWLLTKTVGREAIGSKDWKQEVFPSGRFGVCSRNLELKRSDNFKTTFKDGTEESIYDQSDFWSTALKLKIDECLPVGYAIQGELIGPRIQSNHEKVDELNYFIFDVFDIKSQKYLLPEEREVFYELYLSDYVKHVPIINDSIKILKDFDLQSLLERVEGESINKGTISEGRVYKSLTNPNITFKCVSNKYLLKKKD